MKISLNYCCYLGHLKKKTLLSQRCLCYRLKWVIWISLQKSRVEEQWSSILNPSLVPVLGTLVWRSLESKAKRALHCIIQYPFWDRNLPLETEFQKRAELRRKNISSHHRWRKLYTCGRTPFFFSCPGWHRVHHSPVQFHVQQQLCRRNEPPSNFNHCYFGNKRVSAVCGTVYPTVQENPELCHYLCMPPPPLALCPINPL